ncbi:hypothetical protein ACE6H2_006952 [Prunus campanulata]
MDCLDQLRNRRRLGPEGQLKGIGVRKVTSSASPKKKKNKKEKKKGHGLPGSIEKPKAHGSGRTAQGYWCPQGHGLPGSIEKPKAHGSRRIAQGYWCPQGQLKRKQKKKVMDCLGQLKNRRHLGPEGQLKGIGVHQIG